MKKGLLLFLISFCAIQLAEAQTKIGYTNPQKVLDQLPEVAAIQEDILAYYQTVEEGLVPTADSLQTMIDDYEKVQATLSADARAARETAIRALNDRFEAARENGITMVQQRQNALLAPIRLRINAAIKAVADELDIDMVLNEATSQGSAIIYYSADEGMNITDKVIEKLKNS